jgi:hypothetical protein
MTVSRLVKGSAIFLSVSIHPTFITPAATAHLTAWYATALCFLFSVDSNIELFFTALRLSQYTLVLSMMGTPNIHNLVRNPTIVSMHVLSAINSLENVDVSTVVCLLLYHITGA